MSEHQERATATMPNTPRRRLPSTALATLLLAGAATGCGGGSEAAEPKAAPKPSASAAASPEDREPGPAPSTTAKPLPTTSGELKPRMLTEKELPGYRVIEFSSWSKPQPPVGTETFKPRACGVIAQPEGRAGADVTYEHDGELKDVHPRRITATLYPKGEAARWMARLRGAEERCGTFRTDSGLGGLASERVTWLPEPAVGDEALRMERVTEWDDEMTAHSLTTYVRTGDLVTAFRHRTSYGPAIDEDHLEKILPRPDDTLVNAQIAKLLGHPSTGG
ncbi:hypothetical protein [Streptomyces sp. NPDC058373]|uniref:hypothetical protein n=1 Tax=Streptomyces sp. NPDC058373 TaxID=3346465 RepID=UPI003664976F